MNESTKTKRRVTRSQTMATDENSDLSVSQPKLGHNDDFMTFVRNALIDINSKMDSFIENQAVFENRLSKVEEQIANHSAVITTVTDALEFNANSNATNKKEIANMQKTLEETKLKQENATAAIAKLNTVLNISERHSRSFNIRLLGVKEIAGENCIETVGKILNEKFNIRDKVIENAHRVGRRTNENPRHIIARFYSRESRISIMKMSREKLNHTGYRFTDDLTHQDLLEKRRVRPFMDELFKQNKRPVFRSVMQPATDLRCRVRRVVREAQNVLAATLDARRQQTTLTTMCSLLPAANRQAAEHTVFSVDELSEASVVFMCEHYTRFIDFLLDGLSVEWIERLQKGQMASHFDVFFLKGKPLDSLTVLCRKINSSSGLQQNKSVSLLETFLRQHCLDDLLWDQCFLSPGNGGRESSTLCRQRSEETVVLIATLPERVSNRFEQQTSTLFYPSIYIPFVCKSMLTVLRKIRTRIGESKDCSISFLGQLFGKLCITGYGDSVWSSVLPTFTTVMSEDYIWCRVLSSLITAVPSRCLESVIIPLVKQASWYGILTRFLGLTILTNHNLQYLLTTKLLLMRFFAQDIILQNIVGYMASTRSTVPVYVKTFQKLFEVWSDGSALRHTSYEQHLYVTKALLVCIAFLEPQEKEQLRQSLLVKLMSGIQMHLESSLPRVRRLGMILGEALTKALDKTGESLEFQYDKDEESESLLKLLIRPADPGVDVINREMTTTHLADEAGIDENRDEIKEYDGGHQPAAETTESDLDSDDDLQPFDMSHDVKVNKNKTPKYIRDCMEGLLTSDDPDRVETCLLAAEKLIRLHPGGATEVAVEFTKILLHLQNMAAIDQFLSLRHRAMVALAVISPIPVVRYLTGEFYERNYNLRQRMDMLEVLAEAAHELSHPPPQSPQLQSLGPAHSSVQSLGPAHSSVQSLTSGGWKEIVERRIESHTRRFASGSKRRTEPTPVNNRFAPVAGEFFFPLLRNFDRKENCLDMMGGDHMMLRRLICTLGAIIHEALHAPIARQMATALLQFVWALRYHPESSIRQSLLFAVSMTILSVPAYVLMVDLQSEMTETKNWLEDVAESDVDYECRKMAVQTLVLLQHTISKEFHSEGGDT